MKKLITLLILVLFAASTYSQTNTDTTYYEDGSKKEVLSFNDNLKLHGKCYTWSVDGVQTGLASYRNGVKHGTWKIWRPDGSLVYVMHYREGEKSGTWEQYDKDGNVIKKRDYS